MLKRYKKIIGEYTIFRIIPPHYDYHNENYDKLTTLIELCTLDDGYTYVFIPDNIELPEQPKEITIENFELTNEIKDKIKKNSHHIQLIHDNLIKRIRSKYSIDDEQYFARICSTSLNNLYNISDDEIEQIKTYNNWIEECRNLARIERSKYGL
jgi:hypothetical protein